MRGKLYVVLVVVFLLVVVTSPFDLSMLGSSVQSVGEETLGGLLGQSGGVTDNDDILDVPSGESYTLHGVHRYNRYVNISGTLYVTDYNGTNGPGTAGTLELYAPEINITGTINATGTGWRRNEGLGHGGPLGGGAGGGYGGRGGDGYGIVFPSRTYNGTGGPEYGNMSTWEIQKGSGGADGTWGGSTWLGGDGGGSIVLSGDNVTIRGNVISNGNYGQGAAVTNARGGGGGSGGGILVCSDIVYLNGTLSVEGGAGGQSTGTEGAGGGGGGRIKIFSSTPFTGSPTIIFLGGSGGSGSSGLGESGEDGTFCPWAPLPPKEEVLIMTENVTISKDGSCQLELLMNASSRRLSDIYSRALGFNLTGQAAFWPQKYPVPETITVDGPTNLTFDQSMNVTYDSGLTVTGDMPVNSSFCNGTRQQQLLSLGIDITKFINVTMGKGHGEEFLIFVNASAEFLEKNKTDNNWIVSIGPPNWNMSCDRANFVLTQIGFIQQMLGSFVCEQTYNSLWFTNIILPSGANITNTQELLGPKPKNWTMDFDNGTYMNATLSPWVGPTQGIILTETMRVTEKNVSTTEPKQLVKKGFLCFKVFNIKYQLSNPGPTSCVTKGTGGIDDFRWGFDLTLFTIKNAGFELSFPVNDQIDVDMDVDFNLTLKAHVGLKTKWFKLRRFEAWLKADADLDVNFTVSIEGDYEQTWEQDIFEWGPKNKSETVKPPKLYVFYVGPIPVVVRPVIRAIVRLRVNINGTLEITFGARADGELKIGAGWEDDEGFYPIVNAEMDVRRYGDITATIDAEITPSLAFRGTLLFYETIGPFGELEPYAKLRMWYAGGGGYNVTVGLNINVGIELVGWVKKITGLSDFSWTLFNWVIWVFPCLDEGKFDVAVKELRVADHTFINETLIVEVDVENVGDKTANVTVTSYYQKTGSENWTLIGLQNWTLTTVLNFSGSWKTFVFEYNTTNMTSGEYIINATASITNGIDANTTDNSLNKTVRIELQNARITSVTTDDNDVYAGDTVEIYVTVENNGTAIIPVLPVFVYYNETPISDVWCEFGHWIFDTENVTPEYLTFTWDTTGVEPGEYTIKASAPPLEFENKTDNIKVDGTVTVNLDIMPPIITILFPENRTYPLSSIPLTFTVNEPVSWIGYSLDDQANVTITGNATLTHLAEGLHSIMVYANDTSGNMGASSKLFFTVQIPPPAPPVGGIWIPVDKLGLLALYIALTSTILVATAATAIYVKHAKRRKKKQ